MRTLSTDQKIAALALPVLLFGVLGASVASAHFADLTDDQKSAIEEARELREEGDFKGARDILQAAGVPLPQHGGPNGPHGNGKGEAIRSAIEAEDYDAFVEAAADSPFADLVDEDMFATLVKAHALHESGDHEAARALMEDAGLPPLPGPHHRGQWHHGDH